MSASEQLAVLARQARDALFGFEAVNQIAPSGVRKCRDCF